MMTMLCQAAQGNAEVIRQAAEIAKEAAETGAIRLTGTLRGDIANLFVMGAVRYGYVASLSLQRGVPYFVPDSAQKQHAKVQYGLTALVFPTHPR